MAATEPFDSLPYIDTDISQAERDKAQRAINQELSQSSLQHDHPSLHPLDPPSWTPLMQMEIDRCRAGNPSEKGIDMTRYEAPDEPAAESDQQVYRDALKAAYISSTYLAGRRSNLQLLDEFGKNAWLIGNAQLESLLKMLERDLARVKEETDQVNRQRKAAQEDSKGELLGLEETWRTGIGKIIEVQVATDRLRDELNQRRRDAVR